MIDMHVHVGDGFLTPAEAMNLARIAGYKAVALTLRGDAMLFDRLASLRAVCKQYSLYAGIDAFAAIELVHVPPQLMLEQVGLAREAGAQLVLAHGESPVGLAARGTNAAALLAGVDILAHPGSISAEDAAVAAERGVHLELTWAQGHAVSNAHVVARAIEHGCGLVIGSNARTAHHFYDAATSQALENALIQGACRAFQNKIDTALEISTTRDISRDMLVDISSKQSYSAPEAIRYVQISIQRFMRTALLAS